MRKERLEWAGKVSGAMSSGGSLKFIRLHRRKKTQSRVQHTRVGPSKDDPLVDAAHLVYSNDGIVEAHRVGQRLPAAQVLDVGKRRIFCGVAVAIIPKTVR